MPSSPLPRLMLVQGNRPEDLLDLLALWMQQNPLAPLADEVFLVQSNGIAQWLKQSLAERIGIAAALTTELPAAFLWRIYRMALGEDLPPTSTLDKKPLLWRLMRSLPKLASRHPALCQFLQDDDADLQKRFQLAETLADLYDQYQFYRGDWLEDWENGRDVLRQPEAASLPLLPEDRWQADLWRALLAGRPQALAGDGRAEVHRRFLQRLAELETPPAGLPSRISVFGISALPAQAIESLAALARFSQVFLCVHNPCSCYWGDIVAERDLSHPKFRQRHPVAATVPTGAHGHPLLAAWGKQGRDYLHMLARFDDPERYRDEVLLTTGQNIDLFAEPEGKSLLTQLQNDIFSLRPPEESRRHWPPVCPETDVSIRFHIAHSPQREVEILHDQLRARFEADPALQPRDVIVMMPDVDAYAPHIQAVFGQPGVRHIPYTLADRRQRGQKPLLLALEHTLLRLPEARFAASELLDLLDIAPLRRRFDLAERDLPLLKRWVEGAGVRWGLDDSQRQSQGFSCVGETNSWRFGLRRMLMGYALGDLEREDMAPYAEVGGLEAALLGSLWQFLNALAETRGRLTEAATPHQWGERFRRLLDDFFRPEDEEDQRDIQLLLRLLDDWLVAVEAAGFDAAIPLAVAREAWLQGLDAGGLHQRFLTGAVSFCTLMPMRAIPFRLICLIGMNDDAFPRPHPVSDFDLMRTHYRPGDRSRREDDRYLLLEALLSAREQLYVSWVGRDIRDNSEKPPSTLIGQLRDHLALCWRLSEPDASLLDSLTQVHPLQVFSRRYFSDPPASREGLDGIFTYAEEWRGAAKAPFSQAPLPPFMPEDGTLSLAHLSAFFRQPVQAFFRQRLSAYFEASQAPLPDTESFASDGLEQWTRDDRVCKALEKEIRQDREGFATEAATRIGVQLARLKGEGMLPLAAFGDFVLDAMRTKLEAQVKTCLAELQAFPHCLEAQDFRRTVADLELVGTINSLWADETGQAMRLVLTGSSLRDRDKKLRHDKLAREWVAHLAAQLVREGGVRTTLVGVDDKIVLPALPAAEALALLETLVAAWKTGMCAPLPVALKTALAWLAAAKDKEAAARKAYEDREGDIPAEGEMPELARAFPDFDALLAVRIPHAFAEWAQRLYQPMLSRLNDAGKA